MGRRNGSSLGPRIVRGTVSLSLLALLLWWVDLGQVADLLGAADPSLLLLALGVALVDRAVMIAKWWPLLRVQRLPIGWWRATRVCLAANFASIFLPASVGADVVRALALGRRHGATLQVGASIAMERMTGLVGSAAVLVLAFGLGLGKAVGVERFALYIAGFAGLSVGLALVPFTSVGRASFAAVAGPFRGNRWFGLVERFASAYAHYSNHRRLVLGVTVASALEQLFPVIVYAFIATALGLEIGVVALLVVVPITMLSGRIPIALGGLGVEEGVLVFLLGLFGVPPAAALSLSVGRRIVEILVLLPGLAFWSELAPTREAAHRGEPGEPVATPL